MAVKLNGTTDAFSDKSIPPLGTKTCRPLDPKIARKRKNISSVGNSAQCGSLDGREFGEECIHVYVWLSPFAVHLKLP